MSDLSYFSDDYEASQMWCEPLEDYPEYEPEGLPSERYEDRERPTHYGRRWA